MKEQYLIDEAPLYNGWPLLFGYVKTTYDLDETEQRTIEINDNMFGHWNFGNVQKHYNC